MIRVHIYKYTPFSIARPQCLILTVVAAACVGAAPTILLARAVAVATLGIFAITICAVVSCASEVARLARKLKGSSCLPEGRGWGAKRVVDADFKDVGLIAEFAMR